MRLKIRTDKREAVAPNNRHYRAARRREYPPNAKNAPMPRRDSLPGSGAGTSSTTCRTVGLCSKWPAIETDLSEDIEEAADQEAAGGSCNCCLAGGCIAWIKHYLDNFDTVAPHAAGHVHGSHPDVESPELGVRGTTEDLTVHWTGQGEGSRRAAAQADKAGQHGIETHGLITGAEGRHDIAEFAKRYLAQGNTGIVDWTGGRVKALRWRQPGRRFNHAGPNGGTGQNEQEGRQCNPQPLTL